MPNDAGLKDFKKSAVDIPEVRTLLWRLATGGYMRPQIARIVKLWDQDIKRAVEYHRKHPDHNRAFWRR